MKMKTGGPDGLEAWCVALAACFINFVMAGLGRMSGILYVAFIDIFQVDRMQASVPFSARSLTRNLLGPVVGIIGQKYGVRAATLTGGIIGTLSTAACFYAGNILWITIMWGVINGCGTALTITLPQVILSQHFEKYRTTASGMAFSGGCVGSFLFPVLLEYLLYTYGLGGTFLVLAGIIMNVIPAAMLLNKPSWLTDKREKHSEIQTTSHNENKTLNNSLREVKMPLDSISPDTCVSEAMFQKDENNAEKPLWFMDSSNDNLSDKIKIDTELLRQNNRFITLLLTTHFAERHCDKDFYLSLSTCNLQKELEDLYNIIEDILNDVNTSVKLMFEKHSGGTTYLENNSREQRNSIQKKEFIDKFKRHVKAETKEIILLLFTKLLKEDMNNIVTIFPEVDHRDISRIISELRCIYQLFLECEKPEELAVDVVKHNISEKNGGKSENNVPESHSNTFSSHIRTVFRLHTNPFFLLISFSRSVHFLTFVPAVTIIVDFSMDKGLLEEDGKYVIAALSLGDLMGRLCLGWVTDKEFIKLPRYMLLVMVMQGICTASLSLMHSKIALLSLITLFGLLQGSLFVRHPVLVSKYLGSQEQSVAMGCFNFFSGLLGFTLPNYIGYFRDTVGSYDYIFYINGAIGTIVGLLWLLEPFFVRCV